MIYPAQSSKNQARNVQYAGYAYEQEETPWTGAGWQDSPRSSPRQSPRDHYGAYYQQPKKKHGGKGRGKGKGGKFTKSGQPLKGIAKGNAKGQYKGQEQSTAAPQPPPPLSGPQAAQPPWTSMPTPPEAMVSAQEHPAEQKLNEVMNLLKKKKGDQDLQDIVQKYDVQDKKSTKKKMHSAVNELTAAKDAMEAAVQARSNLLMNWRTFLTASLDRWQEYTEHFQKQEKACQDQITQAKEDLTRAKADFLKRVPGEAQEISDDEPEIKEQSEASTSILSGMQNMQTSLMELSAQAEKEKAEAEERTSKRPRKAVALDVPMGAGAPGEKVEHKSPDGPPFGLPGQ